MKKRKLKKYWCIILSIGIILIVSLTLLYVLIDDYYFTIKVNHCIDNNYSQNYCLVKTK